MHKLSSICRPLTAAALLASLTLPAAAQQASQGLRIFQHLFDLNTYLIDTQGQIVHTWPGTLPGLTAHLMPDGSLIKSGQTVTLTANGATGHIQRFAFDGTLLWDYALDGPDYIAHHEVEPMPNGNVLVIAWEIRTDVQAVAAGRDPLSLVGTDFFPDSIFEIQQTGLQTGDIVWEWHMWDHMVQDFDSNLANFGDVAANPQLLDINYPPIVLDDGDWNHFNGIDYDPIHDLIALSARSQNEIYIIDHSTTTAEAATHSGGSHGRGGDILWRWGNPAAYRAGSTADQQLFGQHDPRFIPPGYPGAGNLTLFNNGWTADQSAVFELFLPKDQNGHFFIDPIGIYGPLGPVWTYNEIGFFSPFMSSAQRLENGNTLICSAQQRTMLEVTQDGQVVWSHLATNPAPVFQSHYIERSLWVNSNTVSAQNGTQLHFDLQLTSDPGIRHHLLLGSASGTLPGIDFGGGINLPLNIDFLLGAMRVNFDQAPFDDTIGDLDAMGRATSTVTVAPMVIPPALVGMSLDFADLVFDPSLNVLAASNAVNVRIVD